jgi:hypothetical protein
LNEDNPSFTGGVETDWYTFYGVYDSNLKAKRTLGFQQCVESGPTLYWWGYVDENDSICYCMDNTLNNGQNYQFTAVCYIDGA